MAPPARDIILRRRARFIASAVGLTLSSPVGARADQDEAQRPPKSDDDRKASSDLRIGVPHGTCRADVAFLPEDVTKAIEALRAAHALHQKKQTEEALREIERARANAYTAKVAEFGARILLEAGHLAAARVDLEELASCAGSQRPVPNDLVEALESARQKTAAVTATAGDFTIDGAHVPSGVPVYLEPGSYDIHVRGFRTEIRRRMAFAGGETEVIEVDNADFGPCLSVCLSPPPHTDRARRGLLGASVSPSILTIITGGDGLTVGAAVAPFVRWGNEDAELRVGAMATPSGGRGFTMPVGGFTSLRIFPGAGAVGVGAGVASGYLIAPSPTRDFADVFQPKSSFFVEPCIPISLAFGSFEIEHRIGVMWSGQEDAVRSRFGASYLSVSVGLTWIPRKSRDEEFTADTSSFRKRL